MTVIKNKDSSVATAIQAVATIKANMARYIASFFFDTTRSPMIFLFLPHGVIASFGIIWVFIGATRGKTKNISK